MVSIANPDLNKELDKYISSRRDTDMWSFFSAKQRKPKVKAEVPEGLETGEVHVLEDEEPGFWERLFRGKKEVVSEDLSPEEMERLEAMQAGVQEIEELEEEHPEMAEELEMERESLLDRFFAFFRGSERRHRLERRMRDLDYVEEEVIPKIDEEVKQVLRIVHRWLERLPKEEKSEFRKSGDFQRYKSLLERYGIAKRKEAPKQPVRAKAPPQNAPSQKVPAQPVTGGEQKVRVRNQQFSVDDKEYPDITSLRRK